MVIRSTSFYQVIPNSGKIYMMLCCMSVCWNISFQEGLNLCVEKFGADFFKKIIQIYVSVNLPQAQCELNYLVSTDTNPYDRFSLISSGAHYKQARAWLLMSWLLHHQQQAWYRLSMINWYRASQMTELNCRDQLMLSNGRSANIFLRFMK